MKVFGRKEQACVPVSAAGLPFLSLGLYCTRHWFWKWAEHECPQPGLCPVRRVEGPVWPCLVGHRAAGESELSRKQKCPVAYPARGPGALAAPGLPLALLALCPRTWRGPPGPAVIVACSACLELDSSVFPRAGVLASRNCFLPVCCVSQCHVTGQSTLQSLWSPSSLRTRGK